MPKINLKMNNRKRVATTRKREYQNIYQDSRWKSISWMRARNCPLCQDCMKLSPPIANLGKETHHVIPWEWGRDPQEQQQLAYDYDNTRRLCIPHHKAADARLQEHDDHYRNKLLDYYLNHQNQHDEKDI